MDNFVVSARKYRPATFHSVIGQDHITSTLKNAIARGQLAHAYLFCGPRGVGKTTCARIFAKAINCLNPKDSEACNECESCRAFNEGRSFSIHELDAASNNSVEDIRNLTDQVRIPPQVGRYSVYIIDEVHMLSAAAFNAFLKTLEEPPAHAIFILATTEKHKIIPTILSRCQIYDFNRIKVEDGVKYLKYIASQEGVTFDDESLHIIAQKADGGMRDALSMYDKVVSFCNSRLTFKEVAATLNVLDYDTYFSATQHILDGDYTSELLLLDEVLRKGFSCQTFVAGLNNHFRDLLMCKDPKTLPLLEVTGSVAERYRTQAAQCSVPLLFGGISLLTQTDGALRTATSQRLTVELSLMKLCGLGQKKNDGAVEPALPPLHRAAGVQPQPGQSAAQPAAGQNMSAQAFHGQGTPVAGASAGQAVAQAQSPVTIQKQTVTPVTQTVPGSGAGDQAMTGNRTVPEGQAVPRSEVNVHTVQDPRSQSRSDEYRTNSEPVQSAAQAGAGPGVYGAGNVNGQPPQVSSRSGMGQRASVTGGVSSLDGGGIQPQPAVGVTPVQSSAPVYAPDEHGQGEQPAVSDNGEPIPFPAPATSVRQKQRFSFAGSSISAILNGDTAPVNGEDEDAGEQVPEAEELDDKIEEKLSRACARFSKEMMALRPRIGVAFDNVTIEANTVHIEVVGAAIHDEIIRGQNEITHRLADLEGIRCSVKLDVTVTESAAVTRPIRPEDKLSHLTERNPLLTELRRELDLEIE